jgi:hypothetical protein
VRGGLFRYGGPVDSTGFMSSPVEDVTDFPLGLHIRVLRR